MTRAQTLGMMAAILGRGAIEAGSPLDHGACVHAADILLTAAEELEVQRRLAQTEYCVCPASPGGRIIGNRAVCASCGLPFPPFKKQEETK